MKAEYVSDVITSSVHDVHIEDVRPRRTRDFADLVHAAASLAGGIVILLFTLYLKGAASGVESDIHTAGKAVEWLVNIPSSLLQQIAIVAITVSVLTQLLIHSEWLQSAVSLISLLCGFAAIWAVSWLITHIADPMLIASLSSSSLPQLPSGISLLPDFYAAMTAFLTTAGPRRMRSSVKWGWNALYTVAVLMVVLSWHSLTGVLLAYVTGRAVGMIIRFVMGTQNNGVWGMQIVHALRTIGLNIVSLQRRSETHADSGLLRTDLDDDLVENSRIYDAYDEDGNRYTVSVLDNQIQIAGYLNQLWQWLRLSGVSMRKDRSAIDAHHHHFDMLLGLRSIGLPAPEPYGVIDSGESSILVLNAQHMPLECNLNTLTDDDVVGFMTYLKNAHHRGYTHRRLTCDTLARMEDGTPVIAGWHNGDYASGPSNRALDQVQLLVLFSTLIGTERTITCARKVWGDKQLVELAPFVQKAAVPAATKSMPNWDKHVLEQLRSGFSSLASQDVADTMEPVTLSRFSLRSFFAIALLVIAVSVVFTQLKPDEMIKAVREANLTMALLCVAFGFIAWAGSALTLSSFMDKDKRKPFAVMCSQMASGFTAVSMPAGVGPALMNLQFLRHNGYRGAKATAIMSAVAAIQSGTTIALVMLIGIFTGRNTLSGMIPTNTLIIVISVIALVISLALAITPIRWLIIKTYLPLLKQYARALVDVMTQPKRLAIGLAGALILNIATGLGFWASLLAFGYPTNPLETVFIFLLANTLGSAVPTPGGLGAVEAALSVSFSAIGIPSPIALSATLVYRVAFYWLRIPIGAAAMKWLDRHNLI